MALEGAWEGGSGRRWRRRCVASVGGCVRAMAAACKRKGGDGAAHAVVAHRWLVMAHFVHLYTSIHTCA